MGQRDKFADEIRLIKAAIQSKSLHQLPMSYLTSEHLLTKVQSEGSNEAWPEICTLLHIVAMQGLIGSLPRSVLTRKNMVVRDRAGRTPMHHAAQKGELGLFCRRLS